MWGGAVCPLLLLLFVSASAEGQQNTSPVSFKALDACQRVALNHAVLAKRIITNTIQNFNDTTKVVTDYLERWGAREIAAQPGQEKRVRECLLTFAAETRKIADKLAVDLWDRDRASALWYDQHMYQLLTTADSQVLQDKIVRDVQAYLDPTITKFGNEASAIEKDAVKSMKPMYQEAARCIRVVTVDGRSDLLS